MNNTIIGQMYPDLNKYSKEVYVNIISTIGLEAYTKDKLGPVTTKLTGGYDKYALVAFNNSNSTSEPLIISNNDEVIRKKAHMIRNMQRYSRYGIHLKTVITVAFWMFRI